VPEPEAEPEAEPEVGPEVEQEAIWWLDSIQLVVAAAAAVELQLDWAEKWEGKVRYCWPSEEALAERHLALLSLLVVAVVVVAVVVADPVVDGVAEEAASVIC